MSNLTNVEKITRDLFTFNEDNIKLTVSNVLLLGKKGTGDIKLDPIFNRTYPSQKYSSHSELTEIKISTSDYIVFSYADYSDRNNIINEDVFISYPNLYDLKTFVQECMDALNDDKNFKKNNEVKNEATENMIQSYDLAAGKILAAVLCSVRTDQTVDRGIFLFINDEEKSICIDYKGVYTLNEIIQSIDLLTLSNQSLLLGLLSGTSSSDSSSSSHSSTRSPLSRRSIAGENSSRGPLGRRGSNFKRSTPVEEEIDDEHLFGNEDYDEEEEEKPLPKRTIKKSSSKKVVVTEDDDNYDEDEEEKPIKKPTKKVSGKKVVSGKKKISLNSIMKEAENIDLDEDEEEPDFD